MPEPPISNKPEILLQHENEAKEKLKQARQYLLNNEVMAAR